MSGQQYDNTNRGALFRNNRKEHPNQPDHTGSLNVAGVEHWVSAWVKEDRNGRKYFSLSVTPKEEAAAKQQAKNFADFDEGGESDGPAF